MDIYLYCRYFTEFHLMTYIIAKNTWNLIVSFLVRKDLSQVQGNIGSNVVYPYVRIYYIEKYFYEMEPIYSFSSIFANPGLEYCMKRYCKISQSLLTHIDIGRQKIRGKRKNINSVKKYFPFVNCSHFARLYG